MNLSQALGTKTQKVINVTAGFVFPAVTMMITAARNACVEGSWEWRYSGAVQKDDGPYNSLGGEGGGAIAKTKAHVQENLSAPADSEKDGRDRIEDEPPVPPGKVQLEDKNFLPGVQVPRLLDKPDDGF